MVLSRAVEVGYVVTGSITYDHLVGDGIPSWRRKKFAQKPDAEAWIRENQGTGSWVLLPSISRDRARGVGSMKGHLDSMGVPEPVRPLGRKIDDIFKHGRPNIDGEVFLDESWGFEKILAKRGERLRCPDVDSQMRAEIGLLEDAYREVHKDWPPAVFWQSRQICECLLWGAEKHRDSDDLLSPANERAWAFFAWRVAGLSVFSKLPAASTFPTKMGGTAARRKRVSDDRLPNRANWLQELIAGKKGLSIKRLADSGGLEHRTVKKILNGTGVTDGALLKLVAAIKAEIDPKLKLSDIPRS